MTVMEVSLESLCFSPYIRVCDALGYYELFVRVVKWQCFQKRRVMLAAIVVKKKHEI
jgi:hypothetical protein